MLDFPCSFDKVLGKETKMAFKKINKCYLDIGEKWCDSFLVTYPVSYKYNGGIVIEGKWYEGFKVAKPKVPKGFKLHSIGCGLQLNAQPPYATAYLKPLNGKEIGMAEMKHILVDNT